MLENSNNIIEVPNDCLESWTVRASYLIKHLCNSSPYKEQETASLLILGVRICIYVWYTDFSLVSLLYLGEKSVRGHFNNTTPSLVEH